MNLSPSQNLVFNHWQDQSVHPSLTFSLQVEVHGVSFLFKTRNKEILESLDNFFPKSGDQTHENCVEVNWYSPEHISSDIKRQWADSDHPDCIFLENWIFQRDFCLLESSTGSFDLVADYELGDGFFNFLRYLLPHRLLKQKKLLLHSGCVLNSQDRAYLFLGHSGAGKTTISKMCRAGKILGDDMVLLSQRSHTFYVEPAMVGQRFYCQELFGIQYPVASAFWLKKAQRFQVKPLKENKKIRFLASYSGLFWDKMTGVDYQKVFSFLEQLEQLVPLYELEFSKTCEVWNGLEAYG